MPRELIVTEQSPTTVKTLKVRVRDKHAKVLARMACETNQVWNYAAELRERSARERGEWLSGFDLQRYTNGASREFDLIGSPTVQQVCEDYASKCKKAKRLRLRWRKSFGERRSLGWVPFKARAAKWRNGQVFFAGHHFKVWDSYGLAGYAFRGGCFSEDARGRWYFCVAVEGPVKMSCGQDAAGVDLGLKAAATPSDGEPLDGWPYRDLEPALAVAQRARKKGRVRAIHATIRNRRHDALHQFSTKLVERCGEIYVGDVSGTKFVKTKMAKSVLDAGWSSLKTMLEYKSRQAGIVYREVNEAHTTVSCSGCGSASGPRGLEGFRVREWECVECGARHDRDVNAARNILALGRGRAPPAEGIPCV